MSIAIDPLIRSKLEQFITRRRRWTILHALLLSIFVWLVGVLLFTWIDAVWILERGTRSILSVATYAIAIAAGVAIVVRRLGNGDPMRRAAIEIEKDRADLRDQLLSAVELASDDHNNGSQSFIVAAQGVVAGRIRGLDVRSLLPLKQLSRPLAIAAVTVSVCVLLVVFPQLQYGNRFARAIVPGFDIDRVSQTRILIERPAPPSRTVPADEITAVVVRLDGAIADSATLQWKDDDGAGGKIKMNESGTVAADDGSSPAARFAANLSVAEVPISYRITAGDGVTRWQQLQPRFRPEVIEFETQMTPPRYTQLPTEPVQFSDGNLTGLAGTLVSLRLRFNMPVEQVMMRRMNTDRRIPMVLEGDRWVINTAIDVDDRYQVLATAVETGFDNPLSPQYAITPIIDNPPTVRWLDKIESKTAEGIASKTRRELVTSFSKLNLSAGFSDEMPMERVEQEVAINGGPWQAASLDGSLEELKISRQWSWDLQLIRYKDRALVAGDVIQTRVVAIDRKRLRGESTIKEFIVSDQEFDDLKKQRLDAWINLAANVIQWKKSIQEQLIDLNIEDKPAANENNGNDGENPPNDEAARDARQALIVSMIDKSATESEAAKLELAARAMRRVEDALAQALDADVSKRRELRWITSNAAAACESIQAETAHQLAMVMTDNLMRMSASIQPIVRQTDPIDWTTFGRYFEITKEQYQELASVIEATSKVVPDSTRQHNTNLLRWIDDEQRRLADAINQDDQEKLVREAASHTITGLRNRRFQGLVDGRISSLQIELMKRLQKAVGWTRDTLNLMVKEAEEAAKANEKANGDNSEEVRKAKEQVAATNAKRNAIGSILTKRLAHDGLLHQESPEADQRYVADTHLLERVLVQIGDSEYVVPEGKKLVDVYREISAAYHWLESGHDVLQWGAELRTLADDDRWNANTPSGRIDGPNRLERFSQGLEFSTNGLQQAGLPWNEVEPIASLRWNGTMNELNNEVTARRWRSEDAVSGADKLDRHHQAFVTATASLETPMQNARKVLESYLPSIAELARKTASTLKESKPKSESKQPEEQERKREEEKRDQAIAQAEQLKESLTDEANTQELMTDVGRRKARNADISLKAIEKRMDELQAAAQETASANEASMPEARKQLDEQTDKAINTLEQIAKHYEQEYPESDAVVPDLQRSESPLQQLEDELGLKQAMDQEFARSDSIARALESDPRELLKKLQQELKHNPLMQKELSEITDQTLTEAQRGLEEQAARERELQLQLERSDPKLGVAKRELEQNIRRSGELVQEIERSLLTAANQAAQSMRGLPALSEQRAKATNQELQEANQSIREAVEKVNQVGSADNQLMSDLVKQSESIAEKLSEAVESLKATDQPLEAILNDDEAKLEEKRRNEERRNMENVQRRARDNQVQMARDQQRRASQQKQREEQEVRNAKQRLQREQENLKRTEERQKKDPENEGLANEVKRQQREVKNAEAIVQAAKQSEELALKADEAAKRRADEIGKTQITPLDKGQPAAQLAQIMEQKAAKGLEQVRESLQKAYQSAAANDAMQPKSNVVASANEAQEKVASEVDEIAEDMARAARHHQRLGDNQLAQATAQASEAVKGIAEGEVSKARESLETAKSAMEAAPSPDESGEAESKAAQAALSDSQKALAEQAQKLGEANQAMNAQAAADAQAAAAQNASEAEAARQKAQTLDELDRSISASQKSAQQSDEPTSAGTESPSPPASATLAAAGRKQAQSMAKKRNQAQQGKPESPSQGEGEPTEEATESGDGTSSAMADFFNLDEIERTSDADWGKLRAMEAEDVAEERRVEISPEYRKQIEAYFRVISEKAKQ